MFAGRLRNLRSVVVTSLVVVAGGGCLLFTSAARADEVTSETMRFAEDELSEAELHLAEGGVDCATMCKALQSMVRAADRICAIAATGDDADRARCTKARERVAEATKRVLAACPACEPVPPKAPSPASTSTAPPPPTSISGVANAPAPSEDAVYAERVTTAGVSGRRARFTVTFSPLQLVLPPVFAHVAVEAKLFDGVSLALGGGFGKLPARAPNNDISASSYSVSGDFRGYLGGRFDGAYLAIAGQYFHATLDSEAHLKSSLSPIPGVTTNLVLGWKLITSSGFTFETRAGLGIVLKDERHAGSPSKNALFPVWDMRVGWSF